MRKDDTVYLRHILDAIEQIGIYLKDVSAEQFLQNALLRDGVVRQLGIIGEAARNVSSDCRHMHHEVPWSEIIGMRNRIIHEYFNVDLTIVWEVVQNDLPQLREHMKRILKTMRKGDALCN